MKYKEKADSNKAARINFKRTLIIDLLGVTALSFGVAITQKAKSTPLKDVRAIIKKLTE